METMYFTRPSTSRGTNNADFGDVAGEGWVAMLQGQRAEIPVDEERLARVYDLQPKTVRRPGRDDTAVALFVRVGHGDQVSVGIIGDDIDDIHIEDFADLLSDQLIDRVHVQLRGKRFLDVVDHQQFRKMLLYLLLQGRILLFKQSSGREQAPSAQFARCQSCAAGSGTTGGAAPLRRSEGQGYRRTRRASRPQEGSFDPAPGTGSAHRSRP